MTTAKLYYHVRAANGCTIDWLPSRGEALSVAHDCNAQVFEVNSVSGSAVRIL